MLFSDWQPHIDDTLLNRLLRPIEQPGVISVDLAERIFLRSHQFAQRLSLLNQFRRRWGGQANLQPADIPIVYAHWVVPETGVSSGKDASGAETSSISPSLPLVQSRVIMDETGANEVVNRANPTGATGDGSQRSPIVGNLGGQQPGTPTPNLPVGLDARQSNAQSSQNSASRLAQTEDLGNQTHPVTAHQISDNLTVGENQTMPVVQSGMMKDTAFGPNLKTPRSQKSLNLAASEGQQPHRNRSQNLLPQAISLKELVQQQAAPIVYPASSKATKAVSRQVNTPLETMVPSALLTNAQYPDFNPVASMLVVHANPIRSSSKEAFPKVPLVEPPSSGTSAWSAVAPPALPLARARPVAASVQEHTDHASAFSPVRQFPPGAPAMPNGTTRSATVPQVNVTAIADQVERKIMRRLTIEQERRGQQPWR